MVHSSAELAKIGEADAEFQKRGKFMRLVSARRDANFVDGAPEAIAWTRVVVPVSEDRWLAPVPMKTSCRSFESWSGSLSNSCAPFIRTSREG